MNSIDIKRTGHVFFFLILFLGTARAQSWVHRNQSSGDNTDHFIDIADYNGSGFVVTGFSVKKGNYKDVLTARISSQGDTLWWRTKNGDGNGNDEGVAVAADFFGNIYVAGTTDNGNFQDDIYLLKYDQAGTLLWDTTWNSVAFLDDEAIDMRLDGSGNPIVVGNVEPDLLAGSSNIVVLKFSPNGGVLWQSIFDNTAVQGGKDEASAMILDAQGNAYVCGRSFGVTSDYDFVTMKFSGVNGARTWTVTYNNSVVNGDDRATDICLDNTGNVLVTGRTDNGNDDDIRTIKYEPVNGILQWTKFYAGSLQQNDRGVAVTVDAADNVYIAGQTDVNSSILTNYDYIMLKYNSAGTILWTRTEGSATLQNDIPVDLTVKDNAYLVVTGYSDSNTNTAFTDNVIRTYCYNLTGGAPLWQDVVSGTRTSSDSEPGAMLVAQGDSLVRIVGFVENNVSQGDGLFLSYSNSGSRSVSRSHNGIGDFTSSFKKTLSLNPTIGQTVSAGYEYQEGQERNAFLQLVSSGGQVVCNFRFNGTASEDDEFVSVAVDYSSNMIYAAGYTKTIGQKSDFLLVKFNPSACDTVWTRSFNHITSQSDRIVDVVVDASGNVYISGKSDAATVDTLDNNDIVTMKYSASGTLLWTQRLNGTGNLRDEPVSMLIASNNNILVCGRTESAQNDDILLIRYDQNTGLPVWATPVVYNSSFNNDDRAQSMSVDGNDIVFISGYSQTGQGASTDDAVVLRVTSQGVINGIFSYDGAGNGDDQAVSVTNDLNNAVYVSVMSDVDPDPLVTDYSIVVLKLDNAISLQSWSQPCVISSPLGADAVPVEIAALGSDVFVAGYADYTDLLTDDILVASINSTTGQLSWLQTYDGTAQAEDESTDLAFDLNGGNGIFISGESEGSPKSQSDAVLLRYEISTGIQDVISGLLTVVYPNPSSSRINWTKTLPMDEVRLMDALGKVVFMSTDPSLSGMDVSLFNSGIYTLVLVSSSEVLALPVSIQHHE